MEVKGLVIVLFFDVDMLFFDLSVFITCFFRQYAIFGVKFRFMEQITVSLAVKYGFVVSLIVLLGGWAVTLARALVKQ